MREDDGKIEIRNAPIQRICNDGTGGLLGVKLARTGAAMRAG